MGLSSLLLIALLAPAQSDLTPLAKSEVFSSDFQWKATEACVRLSVRFGTGGVGSAVIIGHRDKHLWAFTAAHVIGESTQLEAEFFTKSTYPGHDRMQKGVVVVVKNPTIDVALVKIPHDPVTPLPPILPFLAPQQRPKSFPLPVLGVGCDDGFSPKCFDDQLRAKKLKTRPESRVAFFWETNNAPREGRSGGGLLDEKGRVIGVCAANQGGLGYYTHTDEIHAWLKPLKEYDWLWEGSPK